MPFTVALFVAGLAIVGASAYYDNWMREPLRRFEQAFASEKVETSDDAMVVALKVCAETRNNSKRAALEKAKDSLMSFIWIDCNDHEGKKLVASISSVAAREN